MDFAKKKIIIAEDDQDLLYLMVQVLSNKGYEVLGMPNGGGIIEGFSKMPDLFIIDNQMDYFTGEAIIKHLRLQEGGNGIAIIMISGESGNEAATRSGASHFMKKPFNINELVATVDHYLTPAPAGNN